jgi:hypothetical protein
MYNFAISIWQHEVSACGGPGVQSSPHLSGDFATIRGLYFKFSPPPTPTPFLFSLSWVSTAIVQGENVSNSIIHYYLESLLSNINIGSLILI